MEELPKAVTVASGESIQSLPSYREHLVSSVAIPTDEAVLSFDRVNL